jgi:1,4-alpha-glucan branching enzyme
VGVYTRDPHTAVQVWSGDEGYPGDPVYLEFHKKSDTGGHRYWRITGSQVDLGVKAVYDCEAAKDRSRIHAEHFCELMASASVGAPADGIVTAPFDAELFGHWWFEGIDWLETVLVRLNDDPRVSLTTLGRHTRERPPRDAVRLPEGSWGAGGGHGVWMNAEVAWSWEAIHSCEDLVWRLWARARKSDVSWARRAAVSAARQLLILSASDWQFLITTGTATDYAVTRLRRHARDLERLVRIAEHALGTGDIEPEDRDFLDRTDTRDHLFPELEAALDDALYSGEPGASRKRTTPVTRGA